VPSSEGWGFFCCSSEEESSRRSGIMNRFSLIQNDETLADWDGLDRIKDTDVLSTDQVANLAGCKPVTVLRHVAGRKLRRARSRRKRTAGDN